MAGFARKLPSPVWPLVILCQLIVAVFLAWQLLAKFDFAYPLAYEVLDIDAHIQQFAPQNRYRHRFELTDATQHKALFGDVVDAIQNRGHGLYDLRYRTPDGKEYVLFRKPEINHLEEVSKLVYRLNVAGYTALGILLLNSLRLIVRREPMVSVKAVVSGIGIVLISAALITALLGPSRIYHWLHVVSFPKDHQFFFYYQDSLMTTLMKAPQLFYFIGALLLGTTLLIWAVEFFVLRGVLTRVKKIPAASEQDDRQVTRHD